MPTPKPKTQPRKYMANVKASVQLHADGLHVDVIIPWKKFQRIGVDSDELKVKYRKGRKPS